MKLNNKGTSLIELIISIILMAIILLFMLRLLTDVNNEETNNTFATDNQLIRAEILRIIENDLSTNIIKDINTTYSIVENSHLINIIYEDNSKATITAGEKTFSFEKFDETNNSVLLRRWDFKNCTLYLDQFNVYFSSDERIYSLIINMEIHTPNDLNNIKKNNLLDDITLSYIGNINDLDDITKMESLSIGK